VSRQRCQFFRRARSRLPVDRPQGSARRQATAKQRSRPDDTRVPAPRTQEQPSGKFTHTRPDEGGMYVSVE
jgi:hypothetical protein